MNLHAKMGPRRAFSHLVCLLVAALLLVLTTRCGFSGRAGGSGDFVTWKDLSLEATPHLVLAETGRLDFSRQQAHGTLGEGWWSNVGELFDQDPSKKGIMSMSLQSTLFLTVMEPRDLWMFLVMSPQTAETLPAQEVQVLLNGTHLSHCLFEKSKGRESIGFIVAIPAAAVVLGPNEVTLVSKYAVSAEQLGDGDDSRIMAFCLLSLKLFDRAEMKANGKTGFYSTDTHGTYPKPAPMRFEDDAVVQWGTSILKFPMELPPGRPARLRFRPSEDSWSRQKRVVIVCDTLAGPLQWDLYPFGTAPTPGKSVEIDLSPYAGQIIEILFETRKVPESDPVRWNAPEIVLASAESGSREPSEIVPVPTQAPQPEVTNVVFIVLDAWRYDRLKVTGSKRHAAPFLDKLAEQSLLFERAYAAAPYTVASTASLLTSTYPFQHRAFKFPQSFAPDLTQLPQILSKAGIRTTIVSASLHLSLTQGFIDGFDEFAGAMEYVDGELVGAPELVTNRVRAALEEHGKKPFFIYAHYRQPHQPYAAPVEFANTLTHDLAPTIDGTGSQLNDINKGTRGITREELLHLQARYDENLLAVDDEVRKIFEALEANGLAGNTAVIVTADHGEAFLEHGLLGHELAVYDEMTRIPFILKLPGKAPGRIVQDVVASTVDIFPTVCALLGIQAPPGLSGKNLLATTPDNDYGVHAMSMTALEFGWEAYWFDRYKLILNRHRAPVEVYDLKRDPKEQNDLAKIAPVLADHLRARAIGWKTGISRRPITPAREYVTEATLSDLMRERLETLGYLD